MPIQKKKLKRKLNQNKDNEAVQKKQKILPSQIP